MILILDPIHAKQKEQVPSLYKRTGSTSVSPCPKDQTSSEPSSLPTQMSGAKEADRAPEHTAETEQD